MECLLGWQDHLALVSENILETSHQAEIPIQETWQAQQQAHLPLQGFLPTASDSCFRSLG